MTIKIPLKILRNKDIFNKNISLAPTDNKHGLIIGPGYLEWPTPLLIFLSQ